ncbi:MAG: T3SS effector HopA1 family protein [Thermosynechococcaceae cyanobacterium]
MILVFESKNKGFLEIDESSFENKIKDLVENIQITPEFTISYQNYEPLELLLELQGYLNQVSAIERNQYLSAKMQGYLYFIFGSELGAQINADLETIGDLELQDESDLQPAANYVKKWSRTKFYQQLTQNNKGQGYSDHEWCVTAQNGNDWQVIKNGLTLHIDPQKHLSEPQSALQLGQKVAIKMPSHLVDHGMYIAVGDAGLATAAASSRNAVITQLYFNVSAEGAVILLKHFTQKLNSIRIPFSFKVAYSEAAFDSPDAAVLEFQKCDFEQVNPIVQSIYQQSQAYFKEGILFFCKPLASGCGLAEKPVSPKFEQENIGQHYAGAIAKLLIDTWQQKELSCSDRLDIVLDSLSKIGINTNYLYLNPDSTDVY